ncbi:DUF5615 family PIN-like protein [Nitrosococcus oceani]|uniref:DUF5615 family PIN-like protein n=1 Tax=Nitrosococcus oceani TaxID=1229 RepID=UPI0034D248BD
MDQNLSPKLCDRLAPDYEAIHVRNIGTGSASDVEIWNYAAKNNYSIVAKNEVFNGLSQVKGFPPHVIWVRLDNFSTNNVLNMLKNNHSAIVQIIESAEASIIRQATAAGNSQARLSRKL